MDREGYNRGLPLAELMVVAAIIGILVVALLRFYSTFTNRAKISTNLANMKLAKDVAVSAYLSGDLTDDKGMPGGNGNYHDMSGYAGYEGQYWFRYDVNRGKLVPVCTVGESSRIYYDLADVEVSNGVYKQITMVMYVAGNPEGYEEGTVVYCTPYVKNAHAKKASDYFGVSAVPVKSEE